VAVLRPPFKVKSSSNSPDVRNTNPNDPPSSPLPHTITMSTFGTHFRVTTYGESHCKSVGAIIDGCPPVSDGLAAVKIRWLTSDRQGLLLSEEDVQVQLSRRRPGQSDITTPVCYCDYLFTCAYH
jgi:hypothetical protein